MDADTFRRRMRSARELAGLDQAELARKLHENGWIKSAGREQISYVENGQRKVTPKVIEAIAEICGVPFDFLTDENYNPFIAESTIVTGDTVTHVNARGYREVMSVGEAQDRGLISPPPDESHLPTGSNQPTTERSSGEQGRKAAGS